MAIEPFSATTDLSTKCRYLYSFAFTENGTDPGADVRIQLRNGSGAGPVVVDVRLAAKQSREVSFTKPLFFENGIYLLVSAGTARGSIDAD